ncbi:MAG: hypothetical protein KGY48_08875, partial [Wenzhouxiangellaceae bacterium]|nr:hypothetical protein [Wenzhouxiangellaceae bacterium]
MSSTTFPIDVRPPTANANTQAPCTLVGYVRHPDLFKARHSLTGLLLFRPFVSGSFGMNRKFGRAKHVTTENAVVVVTRPAPDHSRLIRSLGEIGRAAIHNPGFRFESEPAERLQRRLKELADFDLAIVTSPMAARLIAAHSTPAMIGNVRFIAPGRGTASILEAA